jgi:hypothetical protein
MYFKYLHRCISNFYNPQANYSKYLHTRLWKNNDLFQISTPFSGTRFVCEGLKREREPDGKTWVSPHATINCGNLKDAPTFEHSTETFINLVGALVVKENAPYTVLREGFGRRAGGEYFDWARKNKHRIFLNLEQESKDVPVRLKIAACAHLVNWLAERGSEGERILKVWKLENLGTEVNW